MFQTFSNTWDLLRSSWRVLGKDKELLIFPIVSGIATILVLGSFLGATWSTGLLESFVERLQAEGAEAEQWQRGDLIYAAVLLGYYFVNYAVIIYFNAALVGAAHIRLTGGDPTVGDGFRAATACLPGILVYALIAATVGLVLKTIRENSENIIARFVAGLLGLAWTLITFLVIPVIVIERKGAFASIGRSSRLLKDTWGEQIVSNLGFGLVNFLLALPGVALVVGGIVLASNGQNPTIGMVMFGAAFLWWLVQAVVMSALRGIFVAALYAHAANEPLEHFPRDMINGAFRPR